MAGVDLYNADKAYRDIYGEGRPGDDLGNALLIIALVRYFTNFPKSKYCLGEQNEQIMQSVLFTDEWRMEAWANARDGSRDPDHTHPPDPLDMLIFLTTWQTLAIIIFS